MSLFHITSCAHHPIGNCTGSDTLSGCVPVIPLKFEIIPRRGPRVGRGSGGGGSPAGGAISRDGRIKTALATKSAPLLPQFALFCCCFSGYCPRGVLCSAYIMCPLLSLLCSFPYNRCFVICSQCLLRFIEKIVEFLRHLC